MSDLANELANLASSLVNIFNAFNTLKIDVIQSEVAVEIKKAIQFVNNELAKHAKAANEVKPCTAEGCPKVE